MCRGNYFVKEFNNGNLSIRFDDELRELARRDDVLALASALDSVDCVFIGESFCLSNFEMGHMIYNFYSDKCYTFRWSELENLKMGLAVRLYAYDPDDDDRQAIEDEGY